MPTSRTLFIVDVQKGFVNDWTAHIPEAVENLQAEFDHVTITRFINPSGSLYRRLIGWGRFAPGSEDTKLAFTPKRGAQIVDKEIYSALSPGVLGDLRGCGTARVYLAGIATDNCVLKTAVDLFEAGIEPVVLADHCASHGGPECHEAGLLLLRRFIGAGQVVDAAQAIGAG